MLPLSWHNSYEFAGENHCLDPCSPSLELNSSCIVEHRPLLRFSLFKIKLKLPNGAQMSAPFLSPPNQSLPAQNNSKESFSRRSYKMYKEKHMLSVIRASIQ